MSFDEIFDLTAGVYFNFYNVYIYIPRQGLRPAHPLASVPNIVLGGLVPQPDSIVLGGLLLISTDVRDSLPKLPRDFTFF